MHLICVGCDHFWFLSISGLFLFPSLSLPVSVLLISFYFVSTIHSQMLRSCCSMFCLSFTYIRDIRNACVSEMLPILLFSFIYWDVFLPGTPYNNGRCCRSYFYQWLKLNCTKRASIRVCVCVFAYVMYYKNFTMFHRDGRDCSTTIKTKQQHQCNKRKK